MLVGVEEVSSCGVGGHQRGERNSVYQMYSCSVCGLVSE